MLHLLLVQVAARRGMLASAEEIDQGGRMMNEYGFTPGFTSELRRMRVIRGREEAGRHERGERTAGGFKDYEIDA